MRKKSSNGTIKSVPKKLVYRNNVYHLAVTKESIYWDEVGDLAESLVKAVRSKELNSDQRKSAAYDAFNSLRLSIQKVVPF